MHATATPNPPAEMAAGQRTTGVPTDMVARMRRIDQLSHWLDSAIEIPGTGFRIGWDTIIGLVPGVGDILTAAMSAWIINEARLFGVSKITLARMIANTSFDTVVGSVPVAGDMFDAAFKSNMKNVRLLRKSLRKRGLLPDDDDPSVRVAGR